jgi:hypothetical protein
MGIKIIQFKLIQGVFINMLAQQLKCQLQSQHKNTNTAQISSGTNASYYGNTEQ